MLKRCTIRFLRYSSFSHCAAGSPSPNLIAFPTQSNRMDESHSPEILLRYGVALMCFTSHVLHRCPWFGPDRIFMFPMLSVIALATRSEKRWISSIMVIDNSRNLSVLIRWGWYRNCDLIQRTQCWNPIVLGQDQKTLRRDINISARTFLRNTSGFTNPPVDNYFRLTNQEVDSFF